MRHYLLRSAGALAVVVTVCPVAVGAQTNERAYGDLSFRFLTPGARAVAMGRSLIGLDDATAGESNPAGLANLQEREVSMEFTATQLRHHRFVGAADLATRAFGDRVGALSFVSAVFPAGRTTIAVFRNVAQHYRESFDIEPRRIPPRTLPGQLGALGEDGTFGRIEIDAHNYGVGSSLALTPKVAIGGSFALNVLQFSGTARSGSHFQPKNGTDAHDTSVRPKFVASVQAKPVSALSLGFAYHSRVSHHLVTTLFGCFANNQVVASIRCGTDLFPRPQQVNLTGETRPIDYVIPDRWVFGVAGRPHPAILLLADVHRVMHSSRITERFQVVDFMNPLDRLGPEDFSIADVTEFHGGGEFRLRTSGRVIAIRSGVFVEPEHRLRFTPRPDTPPLESLAIRFNRVPARNDVGATGGFGITFQNRWQVDVAVSGSRNARDVVFSLLRRFP